jgi:hypothetical protein
LAARDYRDGYSKGDGAVGAGFLLNASGIVKAGTLTTVDDTVAADLANALTTGGELERITAVA